MAEQRAFIDFRSAGDTGVDDSESVQPVKNVEFADEVVFGRPTENLRRRTEKLRGVVEDLLYYRDYGDLIVELTSGGTIAWGGALSTGGSGIVTVTGTLRVSPRASPAQPVRGSLAVGAANANQITYAVSSSGYATHGFNAFTVEHRAAAGQALGAVISQGPSRHLLVTFDSANAAHTTSAVKNLVDSAIAADPALAGKIAITVSGAGVIAAVVETPLSASADDETHAVAGALITTLTTTRKLTVGDGIGIWYRNTIEPTTDATDPKGSVAGGRAESSAARGNHNIPAGSLFITSDAAQKIPGAIVLCRVAYNGQLIFLDGTRIAMGETVKLESLNQLIASKGFATTAYTDNAVSTAVANRATTSYVDNAVSTAVSNRATTTYVDNAVNGRTTATQVDSQITTRLNSYSPPNQGGQTAAQVDSAITTRLQPYATTTYADAAANNAANTRTTMTQVDNQITARLNAYAPPNQGGLTTGQAQALIDNHFAGTVRPGYVTSRATGSVEYLDVNYGLTEPKSTSGGIYISMSLLDHTGELHSIRYTYTIASLLGSGVTITANKWMYLYSYKTSQGTYPVLSTVAPYPDYDTPSGYVTRTNTNTVAIPGGGSAAVGTLVCFGALRTLSTNTFVNQGCVNRVLSFPLEYEPGNRLSSNVNGDYNTALPSNFWPLCARSVTFAGSTNAASAVINGWYPTSATWPLYGRIGFNLDATLGGRATVPVMMGSGSSQFSVQFSYSSNLDVREVTF